MNANRGLSCNRSVRVIYRSLVRYRLIVAYAIIVLSWLPLSSALHNFFEQGDPQIYEDDANALFAGKLPYRDVVLEYPPYAIAIFVLPRLIGGDYLNTFVLLAAGCDLLIRVALLWAGIRYTRHLTSFAPLLYYCVSVVFLKYVLFQRFDLFPAVICLATVFLFVSGRAGTAGLLVSTVFGMKLFSLLFVGPLFILALRERKLHRFLIGLGIGFLPIILLSFVVPWWRFVEYQSNRGLQCESLAASCVWAASKCGLTEAFWVAVKRWTEVQGTWATAVLPWARVLFAGTVLLSIAVASRTALWVQELSASGLARLLLTPLLAFVAFNTVLSPQFMIWLVPFGALAMLEGNRSPMIALSLATMLTPIIFPSFNSDYSDGLNGFETSILLIRNMTLVIVWVFLVREQLRTTKKCRCRFEAVLVNRGLD